MRAAPGRETGAQRQHRGELNGYQNGNVRKDGVAEPFIQQQDRGKADGDGSREGIEERKERRSVGARCLPNERNV